MELFLIILLLVALLTSLYFNWRRYGADGTMVLKETEGVKTFTLELEGDPMDLAEQSTVVFRVVQQ